jgi:hypothetical protein
MQTYTRPCALLNVSRSVFLRVMFGARGNGSSNAGFSHGSFLCVIIYTVNSGYVIQKERQCFIIFIGTFYQNILVEVARFCKIN